MAVDFSQGYSARWRVERIDARTWGPCGPLGGVESIEIDRDGSDDAPLLETASMKVTGAALESFEPGWHRVTMEAVQGSSSEAVPIATLWLESDSGKYDKGFREDAIKGRSVLWQAAEADMGKGEFAPKGVDGAAWCAQALSAAIDAPVSAVGGFELADSYVFDLGRDKDRGSSVAKAVWTLLDAYGWCMQIDGRGEVSILPKPTEPALVIDRQGAGIVQPAVSYSSGTRTYRREWMPNVHPYSLVLGMLPERGLDGLYAVQAQKLTCARGIVVEETVEWLA